MMCLYQVFVGKTGEPTYKEDTIELFKQNIYQIKTCAEVIVYSVIKTL